jgi:glycosyltransferase involved in cell wall biosynthesis
MPLITIFTPTFNRAYLLERVYLSLKRQHYKDFEWLIVDDGGTDNTENTVNELIKKEQSFVIRYIKKQNGGMHSAINIGVHSARGDYFILLGDDDQLCEGILKKYEEYFFSIKNDPNIAGVIGNSIDASGKLLGTLFPENSMIIKFPDIYYKYKVRGDKSLAYKTDILKEYPFPEKEGLIYIKEDVVIHQMAKRYKVLCVNIPTQIVSYQQEGLSKSSYKPMYIRSLAYSYFLIIDNNVHSFWEYPRIRIWDYIHLGINALLSREKYTFKFKNKLNSLIYCCLLPRAYYSYLNIKKHVAKNN